MPSEKRQFGDAGEQKAVEYLRAKGYKILERNWQCKGGELDIVAAKTKGFLGGKIETLVFAEVKSVKSPEGSFLAAQNVHQQKQKKLIRAAQVYLAQKRLNSVPWQIDVVIVAGEGKEAKIEHLANAVWQ